MLLPSRAKGNKHAIMILLPYETFMVNMVVNSEYVRSQNQYSPCWLSWPATLYEEFVYMLPYYHQNEVIYIIKKT